MMVRLDIQIFGSELIRVPLIIRFPSAAFKDKRVKRQVRSIDLMPTILNYSNLKIPQHLDGESLLPLLRLQGEYAARFSFSKTGLMAALRTEEWKLIYYEGEEGGGLSIIQFKERHTRVKQSI